jgi:hypothetical protein
MRPQQTNVLRAAGRPALRLAANSVLLRAVRLLVSACCLAKKPYAADILVKMGLRARRT